MASAANNKRIVELAMVLRAAAPDAWPAFVAAMEDYAKEVGTLMLNTDPAMLLKAQGMAIQAADIAKVLKDAPTIFEAAQQTRHVQNVTDRRRAFSS